MRGGINRIMFMTLKLKLRHCGSKSLIESSYMVEGANYISIGECVRIKPGLHMAAINQHNGLHFSPEIQIGIMFPSIMTYTSLVSIRSRLVMEHYWEVKFL